jgi:hypothetical protein
MTTYAEGTTSLTILDTLNDNMFRVMIEGSFTSGLRWKDVCRGNTQVSAVLKATFSKQAAARVALEDNEIRSLDDFPDTFRILSQDFSANSRSGKLVYKSKSRTIVVFAYGAGKGVLITNSLGSGKTLDFPISKADLYKAFKNASDSDKKVPAHKRIFGRVALEKQRECTIQDLYDEKPESIIVKIDGKDVKLKCEHPSNDFLYYHNAARGFTFCLQKPHAIIEHQGFRVLLDGPKRGENKFRKWLPAAMTIKEAFEIARKEYHAD